MDSRQRASLDRYITGNYGENSVDHEGVLSAECERILDSRDLYSEPSTNPACALIRDEEGTHVATVTRAIHQTDLLAVLSFGTKKFAVGYECGKRDTQAAFRALLDVPANPRNEE